MRRRDFVHDFVGFAGIIAIAAAVAFAAGLSGCAGHEAMVIQRAPVEPPCGLVICEHRGPGRIDHKRDCKCSGKQSLPEIL